MILLAYVRKFKLTSTSIKSENNSDNKRENSLMLDANPISVNDIRKGTDAGNSIVYRILKL